MGFFPQSICFSLLLLFALSGQAYGFGAGNIASLSRIEGQNWRHGDIEDALLSLFLARVAGGRKFSKLDVKRVYFGNWLRDYSQAVDVGTVKYVSAEAIRILIWVLGFMSFGYGTREFEVTTERLGCYQPTEHIDNPLGYAEGEDARNYDCRLRGPVDEERELSIDPRTGLKSYIATEDMGINTSAGLIRQTLGHSVQLGRRYARSGKKEDLHEALRLLGTGLHCLEDYAAHSNYTELSLIELGERNVFPHVGRDTRIELDGARNEVYPIVTGTFGGVDFFHSVLGEFSDKAMQSELQSLEGVIAESENGGPSESFIQDLLSKIPSGVLGTSDDQVNQMSDFKSKADDAKYESENITPREPEEWTQYLNHVQEQIYPILEWHDQLMKSINQAIEKIPVLPELIEQIQDQLTIFVFSVLAPYVLPIIKQVKAELETGSSEVIQSSREQQHIVFNDDSSSNPTHSMLSKDHFSNVLNEPAGRIASNVVKWTVPQIMQCWDDEDLDIDRTLTRIITGVFHHPALREYGDDGASEIRNIMFTTVEQWWNEKGDDARECLREQLSRDGVLEGKNHKEGVQDCGHGCGKPLALPKLSGSTNETGSSDEPSESKLQGIVSQAVGGGAMGGLVGSLVGGMSAMLLNNVGSNGQESTQSTADDSQDEKYAHEHWNQYHHQAHQEGFASEWSDGRPSQQEGYGYQFESANYGDEPVSQNNQSGYGHSRNDYYLGPPPQRQEYIREEYREYSEEVGGYSQDARQEVYESARVAQQSSYSGYLENREYPSEYNEPPRSGYSEYERVAFYPQSQRDDYDQNSESHTGNSERCEYRYERARYGESGSYSEPSDEDRDHHHYHHHHHEESHSDGTD